MGFHEGSFATLVFALLHAALDFQTSLFQIGEEPQIRGFVDRFVALAFLEFGQELFKKGILRLVAVSNVGEVVDAKKRRE